MISVEEAQAIIEKHISPLDVESVPLKKAGNRVLARDIAATFPMPRFNNSAMDGFAVCAADTKGAGQASPVTLKMVGVSAAGEAQDISIKSGECAQCMTGGTVPTGADAIVMVEHTSGFSDLQTVQIFQEAQSGKHIRIAGEEIKKGEKLIAKGASISPCEIGTLATFGYGDVPVVKKPKMAIFATGSELVEPGNELKKGQIYNSNLYVFAALAEESGAEVVTLDVIKDDKCSLRAFLSKAIKTCDVIISSGGVSMGRYDYVREIYKELGVKEHFWKVAQKPGKPIFFGTAQSSLIFGLPGNPVSSFICYLEYVHPVLQDLQCQKRSARYQAELTTEFPAEPQKHRYLFGRAWIDEDEKLVCAPTAKMQSHMLTASLESNCILRTPPGEKMLIAGDKIELKPLSWQFLR